jgi:hypothetical protein
MADDPPTAGSWPPPAAATRRAGTEAVPGLRPDLDAVLGHAAPDRLALLTAAYLLVPALLFLGGWARPAAVPAVLAGIAALPWLAWREGWGAGWPVARRRTLTCLALGLAWAGATGAHHLLYSTADWQIRDAVLHDLSVGPWPVAYRDGGDGTEWLLRAPLGFFLPAGLVGQVAGLGAARAALTAWAGMGFALVLLLLAAVARDIAGTGWARGRDGFAVLAGVFVAFGGLDLIPNLWLDGNYGSGPFASWGRGGEWWARFFQYPGHVTATLWAPNHALPAWLVALLVLRHGGRAGFLRGAAPILLGAAFWSPVSAAGAAVLVGVAALRGGWRGVRLAVTAPANLLALAAAAPIVLYLVAGSAAVPHGFLPAMRPPAEAFGRWALFLAVEVLPGGWRRRSSCAGGC